MIRRGVLFASLLVTLPVMRAFAQPRPAGKTQITTTVSPQVLAAMQQPVTRPVSWPAPRPCVGSPTITHGRRGDSIPVPELRKGTLQQARALLARMHLNIDERSVPTSRPANLVVAQSPPTGAIAASGDTVIVCWLAPQPAAPPASVETTVVVVAPPAPVVQMPRLIGRSYTNAAAIIRALASLSGQQPRVGVRGVNGQPFEPTRSLVDSQRPAPNVVLTGKDAIEIVFRDTTTLLVFAPPQTQAPTPASPTTAPLQPLATPQLFQPPPQTPPQLPAPAPQQTPKQTRTVSQQPAAVPSFPTVTMPLVTGGMYDAAADTLRKLIEVGGLALTPGRRGINNSIRFTAARSVVDSQLPAAGTVLTSRSVVLFIVRDTLTNGPVPRIASITTQRNESSLWKWIVAAGVLLAVAATTVAATQSGHRAEKKRLAALQVIPHIDVGHPRVVFTVRDGERPEDAFARVGLSISAVVDPGKPMLHFPRPPRTRDETTHV